MQIQVNTDANIEGNEKLIAEIEATVIDALSHHSGQITHVEVHLSDENGHKKGRNDKRCMMEARVAGRRPMAVTCEAGTVDEAISGAAERLKKTLESTLDRLSERR